MRTRRFTRDEPLEPIVRLWMLRVLIPMGALKGLLSATIGNDELFEALGVGDPSLDELDDRARHAQLVPPLKRLWRQAESDAGEFRAPAALRSNLDRLSAALGLDDTDRRVLELVCLMSGRSMLARAVDALGSLSVARAATVLAHMLDLPLHDVQRSLAPGGTLQRSGLLRVKSNDRMVLGDILIPISRDFVEAIQIPDTDPLDLMRGSIRRGEAPKLDLGNYPHLERELAILRPYLGHAFDQHREGVNLLFYGPPGTGKTELARVLAWSLGSESFEVTSEDQDGDPMASETRLRAYATAQRLLGRSRSLVLFDECSDAFAEWESGNWFAPSKRTSHGSKGWFNRVLESNPVPTVWLTNDTAGMDAALLRRFDMVIEMPVPPRAVRRSIAQAHCGDVASAPTLDALSESESLAPAVLTRAAAVAGAIAGCDGTPEPDTTLLCLVNQTLRVQGHPQVRSKDPTRLPEIYDPTLTHADVDLAATAVGIARATSARLCLYGPPGTGKSAYARWLAQELDRPLHLRHASDLISKWVGESEKNIAGAFREAERDGAVLVIDEVDGFLQDRRGAVRSWEVTQVNEMLTQMEAFVGVFVATTNLIDGLDAAALRRFDLKAKLDFLLPVQAIDLLRRQCRALGLDAPGDHEIARAARLGLLTPGDFAAVARRHAFQPLGHPGALVEALATECALKRGGRPSIGFIAH
ncbi:MAG: ATP-binding protein [Candidimonas sp.]|nr:MAG: ATP-binding protein [Candidimonas sp.]